LDDLWGSPGSLAVGAGERLHDGWIHSCPACYRNCCGVDQDHSGTKASMSDLLI
jgi:hypothetical protein